MWKPLFIPCLLIIVAAAAARWWFGKRVLSSHGDLKCRVDEDGWKSVFGEASRPAESGAKAVEHGRALREAGLALWKADEPRAARGRDAALRFGLAVPPFAIIIAVLAVLVMRFTVIHGVICIVVATVLAVIFGLMSIGAELRAIARAARLARQRHVFPRVDDEKAACECAMAAVWMAAMPPILRWI